MSWEREARRLLRRALAMTAFLADKLVREKVYDRKAAEACRTLGIAIRRHLDGYTKPLATEWAETVGDAIAAGGLAPAPKGERGCCPQCGRPVDPAHGG